MVEINQLLGTKIEDYLFCLVLKILYLDSSKTVFYAITVYNFGLIFRSMGSSGEFNPQWTMNEGSSNHISSRYGRKGRSNHSIDKMSVNSGLSSHDGSQVM